MKENPQILSSVIERRTRLLSRLSPTDSDAQNIRIIDLQEKIIRSIPRLEARLNGASLVSSVEPESQQTEISEEDRFYVAPDGRQIRRRKSAPRTRQRERVETLDVRKNVIIGEDLRVDDLSYLQARILKLIAESGGTNQNSISETIYGNSDPVSINRTMANVSSVKFAVKKSNLSLENVSPRGKGAIYVIKDSTGTIIKVDEVQLEDSLTGGRAFIRLGEEVLQLQGTHARVLDILKKGGQVSAQEVADSLNLSLSVARNYIREVKTIVGGYEFEVIRTGDPRNKEDVYELKKVESAQGVQPDQEKTSEMLSVNDAAILANIILSHREEIALLGRKITDKEVRMLKEIQDLYIKPQVPLTGDQMIAFRTSILEKLEIIYDSGLENQLEESVRPEIKDFIVLVLDVDPTYLKDLVNERKEFIDQTDRNGVFISREVHTYLPHQGRMATAEELRPIRRRRARPETAAVETSKPVEPARELPVRIHKSSAEIDEVVKRHPLISQTNPRIGEQLSAILDAAWTTYSEPKLIDETHKSRQTFMQFAIENKFISPRIIEGKPLAGIFEIVMVRYLKGRYKNLTPSEIDDLKRLVRDMISTREASERGGAPEEVIEETVIYSASNGEHHPEEIRRQVEGHEPRKPRTIKEVREEEYKEKYPAVFKADEEVLSHVRKIASEVGESYLGPASHTTLLNQYGLTETFIKQALDKKYIDFIPMRGHQYYDRLAIVTVKYLLQFNRNFNFTKASKRQFMNIVLELVREWEDANPGKLKTNNGSSNGRSH